MSHHGVKIVLKGVLTIPSKTELHARHIAAHLPAGSEVRIHKRETKYEEYYWFSIVAPTEKVWAYPNAKGFIKHYTLRQCSDTGYYDLYTQLLEFPKLPELREQGKQYFLYYNPCSPK